MQLYKRNNSPYWWASFTVKSRRFRVSTKETSKTKARLIAAELYADAAKKPHIKETWRLTDTLGMYWTNHGQHQKSAAFLWRKLEIIHRHMDTQMLLTDLTNPHILDFRAARKAQGVGPVTINRDIAVLKAAINHAVELHAQPVPGIAWRKLRYKETEYRIRYLSEDEYAVLVASADIDMAFAILMAVMTGLRKTAMLNVQWHQVDIKGKTITIPKSKANRPHIVRLTEPLISELMMRRMRSGTVVNGLNFRRRWEAARKRAGLEDFRWHDLRHTFGSWSRQAGADLADIMDAMDHSNIAVTMRYAHVDPETHVTAFERTAQKLSHSVSQSKKKIA